MGQGLYLGAGAWRLGLAETTPGPLILVLQFVGFQAGYRHPSLSALLLFRTKFRMLGTLGVAALGGLASLWL